MININIICIGKLKEKYLVDAIKEYEKRMTSLCSMNIIELPEYRISDNPSDSEINKCLENEGKTILSKIKKGSYVISLCIEGKLVSSVDLAKKIESVSLNSSTINFIIGGSYGLSEEVKKESDFLLSIGKMTFPHQLSRLMICEQIYRAFQILKNTKYHK